MGVGQELHQFGLDEALKWLNTKKPAALKDLAGVLDMLKDQGQTLVSRLNLAAVWRPTPGMSSSRRFQLKLSWGLATTLR
jgi:hypothetical protein